MEQRGFGDLEAVVMDCVWDYAEPVTCVRFSTRSLNGARSLTPP